MSIAVPMTACWTAPQPVVVQRIPKAIAAVATVVEKARPFAATARETGDAIEESSSRRGRRTTSVVTSDHAAGS